MTAVYVELKQKVSPVATASCYLHCAGTFRISDIIVVSGKYRLMHDNEG